MSYMITDKRGKVAHVAGQDGKPLCRPGTKVPFRVTRIGRDMKVCEPCDSRDRFDRYAAQTSEERDQDFYRR